jgi:hypothetical protein
LPPSAQKKGGGSCVELSPVGVHDAAEIEHALDSFAQGSNGGLLVTGSTLALGRIHQSLPKPPVQLLLVLAGYSESNTWRQFATDQFRDLAFLFAIQSAAPISMLEPPMKDSLPPQLTAATKELGATAMVPRSQLQVRSEVDEHSARAVFLARCSSLKTSDRKIRPLGEAE